MKRLWPTSFMEDSAWKIKWLIKVLNNSTSHLTNINSGVQRRKQRNCSISLMHTESQHESLYALSLESHMRVVGKKTQLYVHVV
mmetsp:Transcript_27477/g.47615  ORF Transcript_27477/g.47615 Transcript_27477/m.47615 type:complete len:84 (+) Transcript_27477:113-364(+)